MCNDHASDNEFNTKIIFTFVRFFICIFLLLLFEMFNVLLLDGRQLNKFK